MAISDFKSGSENMVVSCMHNRNSSVIVDTTVHRTYF